jgi:Flp pilus assembly protein TadG
MNLLRRRRRRVGATAVEFALVCPILFVTFWVSIEFCRVHMIRHTMQNAVYESARRGLVQGTTDAEIEAAAVAMMSAVAVSNPDVKATQTDDEVSVQMTVKYADTAWVSPIVFRNSKLKAAITLAKEELADRRELAPVN